MSLIAGRYSQNLDRSQIGLDYRHLAVNGSARTTQTRIITVTRKFRILLPQVTFVIKCSKTPESKPFIPVDWCPMDLEKNLGVPSEFQV